MKLSTLLLVSLFLVCTLSYLEISLVRYQLKKELHHKGDPICITKQDDENIDKKKIEDDKKKKEKKKEKKKTEDSDEDDDTEEDIDDEDIGDDKNYEEICYEKDIAYNMPMYLENELQFISFDTTTPISWIKGQKCTIEGSSKKCSLIKTNFKDNLKKLLSKKAKSKKHSKEDYAIIEGSSQLVKGIEQKVQNFDFTIKDSSRLTNLFELLMLGFYMKKEHDVVRLENTNLINATEISQNLNYLCDGAVSLRFDQKSENSFLNELFNFQKAVDKIVTVFIDDTNVSKIAIGDAATKYAEYGFGGIDWIDISKNDRYGKMLTISGVIIDTNGKTYSEINNKQYPAALSLSASYIGIPIEVMEAWNKKFNKKSGCSVDEETSYLVCKNLKKEDENKIITFEFGNKKASFTLEELILERKSSKTTLNLKQTIHNTYAILGEPFFKKYLVLLDYGNDKIGISAKKEKLDPGIINIVSLVRFICFVFLFGNCIVISGCSFILCFTPLQRCFQVIKSRGKFGASEKGGETRRLKQYGPVPENPYDELSGQIKDALEDD